MRPIPVRPVRQALVQAIIAAVALLSGPGGLAGFLRRDSSTAAGRAGLPLDIGYSSTVPAHIRKAVRIRARGQCEWAGGCRSPRALPGAPRQAPGRWRPHQPDRVRPAVLFHHQVMIHRRGWTLAVNPTAHHGLNKTRTRCSTATAHRRTG